MVSEERLIKQIKSIYTEIEKRLVDPSFKFPNGGATNKKLSKWIKDFSNLCGGDINSSRIVDYCIFQIHKNRNAQFQQKLAPNVFGKTALDKYKQMSSREKAFMENQWLSEAQLTRAYLNSLISEQKQEHPQAKYIYMEAEESTKKRCLNTQVGYTICQISTLMWSPFSETCNMCTNAQDCMKETERKYPELYRIRIEKYGKG